MEHSGFGPFCHASSRAVDPYMCNSLQYCKEQLDWTPLQWFEARLKGLQIFEMGHAQKSATVGFCVCCSFTSADAIFNALYNLEVHGEAMSLSQCFAPRPQSGYWFPRLVLGRSHRTWDAIISSSSHTVTFEEGPRTKGSDITTLCVQLQDCQVDPKRQLPHMIA